MFYLNFEDFSIVKLRSTVFMLNFPISYTIAILNLWIKLIPNPQQVKAENSDYTKEE